MERKKEILFADICLEKHPVNFEEVSYDFVNSLNIGDVSKMLTDIVDLRFYLACIEHRYGLTEDVNTEMNNLFESSRKNLNV